MWVFSARVPGQRKSDQDVTAFSAPKSLLREAIVRANEMGMSKTGFYRYCLAKELGYSAEDARALAEHRGAVNARAAVARSVADERSLVAESHRETQPKPERDVNYRAVKIGGVSSRKVSDAAKASRKAASRVAGVPKPSP